VSAKKRKISPAALSVLIGLAGAVVLAGGLFLLVLPQRHQAADLKGQIADTELQITQARQAAAPKLPQPIHVANLFKLVKAMPDNPDMPGILLQLNQTASDAGIDFDAITPQAPVAGAVPVQVPISLEFTGNFYDLNDFLFRLRSLVAVRGGALQASGRLFSVDSIEFTQGADGFPNISAKINVKAYVYGTGTTTPATPAAPAPATPPSTPSDPAAVASGVTS
jgi:Tfp pilus assembly protein PilO